MVNQSFIGSVHFRLWSVADIHLPQIVVHSNPGRISDAAKLQHGPGPVYNVFAYIYMAMVIIGPLTISCRRRWW